MHSSQVIGFFSRAIAVCGRIYSSSMMYFVRKNGLRRPLYCFLELEYEQNKADRLLQSLRTDANNWARSGDRTVQFLKKLQSQVSMTTVVNQSGGIYNS